MTSWHNFMQIFPIMGMFVFLVPKIPTFLASHKIGVGIGVTTLPPLINIPINPVFLESSLIYNG